MVSLNPSAPFSLSIAHTLLYGILNFSSCSAASKSLSERLARFKMNEAEWQRRRGLVPQKCGIYKITNPKGEVYIGGSRTVYRRWLRHREARKKIKIHLSIKEFGWRQHIFEIVHELPLDVSDSILIQYEQLYMDFYREAGFVMLNVKDAGSKAKFPEESRKKMSEAQIGKVPWNKGKKMTVAPWNKGQHIPRITYSFQFNGDVISVSDLKTYCKEHELVYTIMLAIYNNSGVFYGAKNFYKGYSRVNQ